MAELNLVEKVLTLESVELFRNLKPEQLARIAAVASEISVGPRKEVYDATRPPSYLFVVVEGAVELSREGESLAVARQNEVLGAWALFDDEPLAIRARTLEDTRLMRISRDDFYDVLADNPEITQALFSTLVKRFRKLVEPERRSESEP
jgi:CRP-like cAMP-binding protein